MWLVSIACRGTYKRQRARQSPVVVVVVAAGSADEAETKGQSTLRASRQDSIRARLR
jgi:hypothetical protein